MDGEPTALERVLKRARHIVIGGLVFVSLVSWLYILTGAGIGAMASVKEGAALPQSRLPELLPWNWKATRQNAQAA